MRLLLIESRARFVHALRQDLAREGFHTEWAPDGRSGLRRALDGDHDVIVLDVLLAGLNGYEVCSRIRAAGRTTPVLILTAKDGEHDIAEGLESGADDYLVKPFAFLVLVARLRALLRRRGQHASAGWQVGDLRVDPVSMRVWRGDTEIELTAKEFGFLACLTREAERVVTKPQIIERVWEKQSPRQVNVVEVYISTLRRKIDRPFRQASIVTVRGAGYKFVATGGPGPGRQTYGVRTPTSPAAAAIAMLNCVSEMPDPVCASGTSGTPGAVRGLSAGGIS
ncbi:response regulator transcription factor [Streptomyces sp. NPDC058412]|uniref:response regulator transcription factor n=1 Tax=Streptomyces sp. NPDC058412 TaxID=3346486 RepID=UPI0036592F89